MNGNLLHPAQATTPNPSRERTATAMAPLPRGALGGCSLSPRVVALSLSFWGLLFANGLVHSAGGVAAGAYNTGLWSAAFLFVPLSLWVIYASAIRGPYSGKVVGVAYAAGALTHVLLFMGYGFFKAGVIGNAGLLVYAAVTGFAPIILAAVASRFFKPELLRPVPVQQATA